MLRAYVFFLAVGLGTSLFAAYAKADFSPIKPAPLAAMAILPPWGL